MVIYFFWQAISARNRDNQAKNVHPHHMGRGGYGKLEERYVQAQLKNSILSGASSSMGVESETPVVTPRLRHERWMDGRKDKNGNIPNEKTKLVVEKINELREKEKSGEFVSHGSHDILTEALGNPEHGGHVSGKATLTSVFKRKKVVIKQRVC